MKNILITLTFLLYLCFCISSCTDPGKDIPEKKDHLIDGTDGIKLHVREIYFKDRNASDIPPLLMVHGGGPGAVASFDLDVPGGSLATDIARKGPKVYIMNIRGWEKSTLPEYDLSDSTLIVGNYRDAGKDINSVIDFIRERDAVEKVSYFGWATGGHWGGYYATLHPDKLAHFISLNSLYGTDAPWELKPYFQSEKDSSRYNKQGFFRKSVKNALTRKWTSTIPTEAKEEWRDPEIAKAYRETAVKLSTLRDTMLVPGGYREESFYMSNGKKYWDAGDISTPSLIIRSALDFWSRPDDLKAIDKDLNIEKKRIITIPGTHYLFLDRPERGRNRLIEEIVDFTEKY
ncbi:alpha/beta hydrolase [Sinomicrobium kalidii]|uniref:alpha/beta fold hydrolase n=1 Tax=Sinomicrobium kalidii TaxID=2900738 RepID=UPI001E2E53E6|nr:alpha/beta fold hydrolase [Sinomicrobium kalidii]UGU16610.1 alpha/beta hydrolase [Sinomicrobium kalidii]